MTETAENDRSQTATDSAEKDQRRKRRDRRVLLAGELSDRQVTALREAEVPTDFAYLDAELEHWNP